MKTAQDYHGGGNGKIFDNMVLQDSKHAPLNYSEFCALEAACDLQL